MRKKNIYIFLTLVLFSCKTSEIKEEEPETALGKPFEPVEIAEVREVSEFLYNRTIIEIQSLINCLTEFIREGKFHEWRQFLSDKYIKTVGSADYLDDISQNPRLKGIVKLNNLRDYFEWVVVPSRQDIMVDKIVLKNEQQVTAYTYVGGGRKILFQFALMDGKWLVTIW